MNEELWSQATDKAKMEWLRQQVKLLKEISEKIQKQLEEIQNLFYNALEKYKK